MNHNKYVYVVNEINDTYYKTNYTTIGVFDNEKDAIEVSKENINEMKNKRGGKISQSDNFLDNMVDYEFKRKWLHLQTNERRYTYTTDDKDSNCECLYEISKIELNNKPFSWD